MSMNATFRARFGALPSDVSAYLAQSIMKKHPDFDISVPIIQAVEKANIKPTDIVMMLASDSTPEGVIALETLTGKTIDKVGKKDPDLPPDVGTGAPAKPAKAPRTKREKAPKVARAGKVDPRIISFVLPNPKKVGSKSAERYEHYRVGARVDEVIAKDKLRTDDLAWDLERGHIQIVSPEEWAKIQEPAEQEPAEQEPAEQEPAEA